MPDERLVCVDCGNDFVYTARDQEFYASQHYTPPKRCKPCRAIKKDRRREEEARRQAEA